MRRALKVPNVLMQIIVAGMSIIMLAATLALTIHAGTGPPINCLVPVQPPRKVSSQKARTLER
jgi:hypothetical protein